MKQSNSLKSWSSFIDLADIPHTGALFKRGLNKGFDHFKKWLTGVPTSKDSLIDLVQKVIKLEEMDARYLNLKMSEQQGKHQNVRAGLNRALYQAVEQLAQTVTDVKKNGDFDGLSENILTLALRIEAIIIGNSPEQSSQHNPYSGLNKMGNITREWLSNILASDFEITSDIS